MKILSKLDNTGMIEETADKRYVTDAEKLTWNSKADKTYVDNQDALKADKTEVEADLELKADKTYVDNKVKTDVPAGAKFTDTVYTHPTTAGNKHIPAGGASGQVLKYSANGTATWQTDKDTITTINGKTGAISKADITALGIPAQDTVYSHPTTHPASMITESSTKRFVSDSEKSTWNSKSDTDTVTTINGKTGAISKADIVALGIPAEDTNTTYSEITTAEIDAGTASTRRTITGRRIKYILDKVAIIISNLTKSDVGLEKVDNTSDLDKPVSTATQTALDGKVDNSRVLTDVPVNAKFTDTIYTHPANHPASIITESTTKKFVSDTEKANWNNKWDYNESTIKAVKVSSAGHANNADNASKLGGRDADYYASLAFLQDVHDSLHTSLDLKVDNSRVLTDVPANANFSDTITSINGKTGAISKADIVALGIPASDTNTTYSEITTAEIDTGTASTLRTITARRLKYLLDKIVALFPTKTSELTNDSGFLTRWPTWSEVTSKPTTATRWPTWSEVTSKPSTFAPSSHSHAWSTITSKPADNQFPNTAQQIGASQNLNNYTTPGFYYQSQNANASTSLNYPEARAGTLIVTKDAGTTQMYYEYSGRGMFYRTLYGSSWSAWREIYHSGNRPIRYQHNITITQGDSDILTFSFINSSSTAYTSMNLVISALYTTDHTLNKTYALPATGIVVRTGANRFITGVYSSYGTQLVYIYATSDGAMAESNTAGWTSAVVRDSVQSV